jgi:hypothetical protein
MAVSVGGGDLHAQGQAPGQQVGSELLVTLASGLEQK